MADTIPCPNPTCTHGFSTAALQTGAALQCPKCGFRIKGTGKATPQAPTKSKPADALRGVPVAKPASATVKPVTAPAAGPNSARVVMATPIAPQVKQEASIPVAQVLPLLASPITAPAEVPSGPASPEDSIAEGTYFNPESAPGAGALVRSTRKKKKFNWVRLLIVLFVMGFAVSVGVIAFFLIPSFRIVSETKEGSTGVEGVAYTGTVRSSKGFSEKVYKLILPRQAWSVDNEIQTRFGAHAAWKNNERDFWFGLVVKDYDTLKPRDAEMLRVAVEKLENYFGDAMELDAKAIPAKIGELPAQKIRFKGQIRAANWLGECYMFFQNGVAYWLYLAAPDFETVEYYATELLDKNLTVISERRGWREQVPPVETFRSESGMITMTAPKGVWEKNNAKNEDEKGDLFLFGRYQKEKDNRKNATMLLVLMEKKSDLKEAIKAAREYLENKTKSDNSNFKLVQATDVADGQSQFGSVEDVGNRRGRLMDLKLQFNEEPKRYYLLAVVNESDICYTILCDCTWESRQIWREDFVDLLRTFRIAKKAD